MTPLSGLPRPPLSVVLPLLAGLAACAEAVTGPHPIRGPALLAEGGSESVQPADEPPVASYTWSCDIEFTCTFDGSGSTDDVGIVSWEWFTGPTLRGTGEIFVQTFEHILESQLTLRVTDTAGQTDEETQTIVIEPGDDEPPVAAFTWSCDETLLCTFDGTASTDDFGVTGYQWLVRGNVVAAGSQFQRQFRGSVVFDLTLQVRDRSDQRDTVTERVMVR